MAQRKGYDTMINLYQHSSVMNAIIADSWHTSKYFIGRYLTNAENSEEDKKMTLDEVKLLSKKLIDIVSIYQTKRYDTDDYTFAQGRTDAQSAIAAAAALHQPDGTPIYFAIEYPDLAEKPTAATAMHNYLNGVSSYLSSVHNTHNYKMGVYGPSENCRIAKSWFAAAYSMYGSPDYGTFSNWNIKQKWNPSGYTGSLVGTVDFDTSKNLDYGGWQYHVLPSAWSNYNNPAKHRKKCSLCNNYFYEAHTFDPTGTYCTKCGYGAPVSLPENEPEEERIT